MELIKQIKEAEKQAGEIVDKAKQDAVALSQAAKARRDSLLQQAQKERQQSIDEAITEAQKKGACQVQQLSEQGDREIAALKESCSTKIQSCVSNVISHLQQALWCCWVCVQKAELSRTKETNQVGDIALNQLTPREIEVLKEMVTGRTNKEIAKKLVISQNTVKYHVHALLDKLNLSNRREAAEFARRHGLVD